MGGTERGSVLDSFSRNNQLDKHSIKIHKQISRKKRRKKPHGDEFRINTRAALYKGTSTQSKHVYNFTAPPIFSIEKNPEETIQFYNKIISRRNEHKFGAIFFIDSENVTEVTVDAIMYLIAIVTDTKYNITYKYRFEGNFPTTPDAKRVYEESGFMAFVHSKNTRMAQPQVESIQILKGKTNDPGISAKVCEFVQKNCSLSRIDTIPLYNILVELMGNTVQHAYTNKTNALANFWYLFAEKRENEVNFVFLDTGLGIPTTVQKKIGERIPFINRDSEFIKSALEGEFRTQTRIHNRGKGLPQISECFRSGILKNVFVYSGKGCCILNSKNQTRYETSELKNKIFGTLLCWQIAKY